MVRGIDGLAIIAEEYLVCVFFPGQHRSGHPLADLDTFDGIDRHHRSSKVGVQLAVYGRTQTGRHAARDNFDNRSDGIA